MLTHSNETDTSNTNSSKNQIKTENIEQSHAVKTATKTTKANVKITTYTNLVKKTEYIMYPAEVKR